MKQTTNPDDRKAMIQKGFDTVASGYDHPSLSFFPETAKRLVEHLQLNPTDNLLDVCTGTGVVALTAAEKLTEGKVTGIDLSSGMLQQATNKAAAKGLSNVSFQQMDLEHLTFPQGSFDVATCSFGLFFMEDMTKALSNISNAVRSTTAALDDVQDAQVSRETGKSGATGGKVAITTFAGEAFSPMADIFFKQFQATGREIPPLSWKRLSTEELIREQFKAVGITKVEIHHEPLGYQMTDPQQWWDVVWNAGWRSLLNQLSDEERKEFEKEHMKEIAEVLGNDAYMDVGSRATQEQLPIGVWFNTEVLIAVGEKQ